MRDRLKRWIAPFGFFVVLAVLIAWRLIVNHNAAEAQSNQQTGRSGRAASVTVATAAVRDVIQSFDAVGDVEAPLSVKLAPKTAGQVLYVAAHEGDHVTAGEVLVKIDPSEAQADVAQEEANVAQAQQKLAEAQITQNPTDVGVTTAIRQQEATLAGSESDYSSALSNSASTVAAAGSAATDADARVSSARSSIANSAAELTSAQANLENAQAKYDRQNTLFQKGFVAQQTVDDARTTVDVAKASVDVAQAQLSGAKSALVSAQAQLASANQQVAIAKTTGRANIAAADAHVKEARAALASAQANTAQKPAYEANLAALKSAVTAAQAQLANAQAVLGQATLRSPIDGFVTARYVDPGSIATAGQSVIAVQQLNPVWITTAVPEEMASSVYPGQTAIASLDALPGRTFTGKVIQVNRSADPSSRQFSVRITLDNPTYTVKPGMYGRVSVVTSKVHNALAIPREAVQQSDSGNTVFVLNSDSSVTQRTVTLGVSDTNGYQILSGVTAGEQVVTISASPLRDGQKVKLAKPGAGAGDGTSGGDATGGHKHHKHPS